MPFGIVGVVLLVKYRSLGPRLRSGGVPRAAALKPKHMVQEITLLTITLTVKI